MPNIMRLNEKIKKSSCPDKLVVVWEEEEELEEE